MYFKVAQHSQGRLGMLRWYAILVHHCTRDILFFLRHAH